MSIQGESEADTGFRHISEMLPAMQIVTKTYSLQPDMLSGWKPKMRIVGPVPLNFDNPIIDCIVEGLTSYGKRYPERVVYLGNRPMSSYKMHQDIRHAYEFKYAHLYTANYSHLAAFFRKFYSNFQSKRTRLFRGMNPTVQSDEVQFDSNYEGGNLDAAIRVAPGEYDLFMRIDSNTRGHVQWFNFTVKNGHHKKIKLNICNFRKEKTLFNRGMRPYVFSKHLKQTKGADWAQGGINVKFDKQRLRYELLEEENYSEESMNFNCLQFEYIFQKDNDEVSFAYCPPYSYSDLLAFIKTLMARDPKEQFIKEGMLCQSLSGLPIPLLTITDFSVPETEKKCIIVSGRIHPGESNGSHMMHGFLDYVCDESREARQLRSKLVIKAIPMLNPDGVVLGNFRTSLCGRDLNRAFRASLDALFPEVKYLKELAITTKQDFKNRLTVFIDFHGHSVKKNVFIYGPEYGICESNYYKTRILPKLISTKTEMFRYYSCMFRIASFKRATARAVLLRTIPHCYTVQASNAFFYTAEDKKDNNFTGAIFAQMGSIIADTFREYIDLLIAEEFMQAEKRRRLSENKNLRKRRGPRDELIRLGSNDKYPRGENSQKDRKYRLSSVNSVEQPRQTQERINNYNMSQHQSAGHQSSRNLESELTDLPLKTRQLINEIKKEEQQKKKQSGDGHDSDNYSQGGSDSESGDDLERQELDNLHETMIDVLEDFKSKFLKKKMSEVKSRREISGKKTSRDRKQKEKVEIEMIPSLRKKAMDLEGGSGQQPRRRSFHKHEVFNWPKIREDFVIRTNNLRTNKSFAKTQLNNILGGSNLSVISSGLHNMVIRK